MGSKRKGGSGPRQDFRRRRYTIVAKAPPRSKISRAVLYVLDHFSIDDIETYQKRYQDLYDFFWSEFAFYSQARSRKTEEIRSALREVCEPLEFDDWHRVVAFQYSTVPLSAKGSRLSTQGGRFNIGSLDASKFIAFPALYLAEDAVTARSEWFRSDLSKGAGELAPHDFSLTLETSNSIARIRGRLGDVVDLSNDDSLRAFLKRIRRMAPSDELLEKAESLGLNRPTAVRNLKQLKALLFAPDWAFFPTFLDIPHNSQIFGLFAKLAGVEGLVYPSKFTGRKCLAVFPENINGDSFVELKDRAPDGTITVLNKDTWKDLV